MSKIKPTALRVTSSRNVMTVQAGTVGNPGNRKFKNESAFWYALKKTLEDDKHCVFGNEPPDLVKKVMSKDGHLMGGDGYPYYLRDRKWRYCIHDPSYALRDLTEEFYKTGAVVLAIERWEEPQGKSQGEQS